MDPGAINTDHQQRQCLEEARRLAAHDPEPKSSDGARLELLAKLIEDYERERFGFRKPSPVEAILFRMQEQGGNNPDWKIGP